MFDARYGAGDDGCLAEGTWETPPVPSQVAKGHDLHKTTS
jgi:hypothetical protein